MAVIFMDGFEHYSFTNDNKLKLLRKWTDYYTPTSTYLYTDSSFPRYANSQYLVFEKGPTTLATSITKGVSLSNRTAIIGLAVYFSEYPDSNSTLLSFKTIDGSQFAVFLDVYGGLHGIRYYSFNESYCVGHTGPETILQNQWAYLEVMLRISNTTGIFKLRVNSKLLVSAENVDTQYQSTDNFDAITINSPLGGYSKMYLDDVYIIDVQSSGNNNDFLGDCRIIYLPPSSNGDLTQWDPYPTSLSNYECIDELDPNDDEDYVQTNIVGNEDTYNFQTPPNANISDIYAVSTTLSVKKDEPSDRFIRSIYRINNNNYYSSPIAVGNDYSFKQIIFNQNPATSASWQENDLSNGQFGLELTS